MESMKQLTERQRLRVNTLGLHSDFPEKIWMIVEQPANQPWRLKYNPKTGVFSKTGSKSLSFLRGFSGAYGWIAGTGLPPGNHFDVLLLTKKELAAGEIVEAYLSGVFFRNDNDHKFVAIEQEYKEKLGIANIDNLDPQCYEMLLKLYPKIGKGEGWFGQKIAREYLLQNKATHK